MDVDALVQRVALLERRQRRLQTVAVTALVTLAAVALMGQAGAPKPTVTAQEFVLVDKAGVVKARIGSNLLVPGIELQDPDGHRMLHVERVGNQTSFAVSTAPDPKTGFPAGGGMTLLAGDKVAQFRVWGEKSLVSLNAGSDGSWIRVGQAEPDPTSPLLKPPFSTPEETAKYLARKASVELWATSEVAYLTAEDREGFETRVGNISLQTTRTGAKSQSSAAAIAMFSKDKTVLWRAP
jgi:hypothetical protein